MRVTFAHLAGVPLEEGLLAVAPAAGAVAILVAARLRQVAERIRR